MIENIIMHVEVFGVKKLHNSEEKAIFSKAGAPVLHLEGIGFARDLTVVSPLG